MKIKMAILLGGGTALVVVTTFMGLMVAGAFGEAGAPTLPPRKAAQATLEAGTQQTAAARPRAPKLYLTPIPTRTSCAEDLSSVWTGVWEGGEAFPEAALLYRSTFDPLTFVKEATAIGRDGHPYSLYLATLRDDPSHWVIVAWRGPKDPCAEHTENYDPKVYELPRAPRSVTLSAIDDGALSFTADGRRGTFDYVAGTFFAVAP
jgi:hypothetical protein